MQSITEKESLTRFFLKMKTQALLKFLKIYIKTKDLYSMKQNFICIQQFFTYLLFVYLLTSLTFQCYSNIV